MINTTLKLLLASTISIISSYCLASVASAHQPFFEDDDTDYHQPMTINDPEISTALYGTLETSEDVDYFTFEAEKVSRVLVAMTIPQIEGQQEFSPTMAILGPGLPAIDLPELLLSDDSVGTGGMLIHPTPPQHFFEPFSRTSYWRRQRQYVDNLQQGTYIVAVWHELPRQTGRYVLVVGEREVRGGDPQFDSKIKEYWRPVTSVDISEETIPLWQRLLVWLRVIRW